MDIFSPIQPTTHLEPFKCLHVIPYSSSLLKASITKGNGREKGGLYSYASMMINKEKIMPLIMKENLMVDTRRRIHCLHFTPNQFLSTDILGNYMFIGFFMSN